jgi:threonine aldolase
MHFWSDNSATVAPQIMAALEEANQGVVKSYGADAISARLGELFSQVFEKEVAVLPVPTGTAANALALALLAPPFGAIFCHRESDIHLHACGAPEFYTGGAKLMPIDGPHGKLEPNPVAAAIAELPAGFVHNVQSAAISVAQATECGTVYERQELAALAALARTHELGFHIDGARFANAVTALGCHPAEITWQAGVDVLSFGATKNGAMGAEAVVCFDPALGERLGYLSKRGGHLVSKMRFLAVQLEAYLKDDLWLANARHANAMAERLARAFEYTGGIEFAHPVQANEIFVTLPEAVIAQLEAEGAGFYRWGSPEPNTIRLVTSFNTEPEQVDAFVDAVKRALRGAG